MKKEKKKKKKKRPPAQCRKADEIYLKLQKKNAPFPTRQWIYVFLPIAKIPLPDVEKFRFQVPSSRI